MYISADLAMTRRERLENPGGQYPVMQQPGLGAISDFLKLPTFNTSPLLTAGMTLIAVALLLWVSQKGKRIHSQIKRTSRKKRARKEKILALKKQLREAQAS
jgi:heme exporter protein D